MKSLAYRKLQGFTLFEILISVLVLSFGLLGIASLQLNAMKYNQSAHYRSIAVYQAESMLDRMRANPTGLSAGNYNSLSGTPALPSCSTCTAAQSATRDLSEWNTENAALLPSGVGTVSRAGDIFTIQIQWDNDRQGTLSTFQLSSEL